mgnify:FL=1
MPVFDFSNPESTTTTTEVTYTTFHSDKNVATPEDPILLLDNAPRQWAHHPAVYSQILQSTQHLNLKKKMALSVPIFFRLIPAL